jgi:hypothetical protein
MTALGHERHYRRAILDYWAEHDETLGAIVKHVLVHEIGHHFGFSEASMEAIEASVDDIEDAKSQVRFGHPALVPCAPANFVNHDSRLKWLNRKGFRASVVAAEREPTPDPG